MRKRLAVAFTLCTAWASIGLAQSTTGVQPTPPQTQFTWRVEPERNQWALCNVHLPYDADTTVVLAPLKEGGVNIAVQSRRGFTAADAKASWKFTTINGDVEFFHPGLDGDKSIGLGGFIAPSFEELMLGTDRFLLEGGRGRRFWVQAGDVQRALRVARFCNVGRATPD